MQYSRAVHVAYVVEHAHYGGYVMAVEGAEVAYVETFEEVLLLANQRFEAVVEPQQRALAAVVDQVQLLEQSESLVSQVVVELRCRQVG